MHDTISIRSIYRSVKVWCTIIETAVRSNTILRLGSAHNIVDYYYFLGGFCFVKGTPRDSIRGESSDTGRSAPSLLVANGNLLL